MRTCHFLKNNYKCKSSLYQCKLNINLYSMFVKINKFLVEKSMSFSILTLKKTCFFITQFDLWDAPTRRKDPMKIIGNIKQIYLWSEIVIIYMFLLEHTVRTIPETNYFHKLANYYLRGFWVRDHGSVWKRQPSRVSPM